MKWESYPGICLVFRTECKIKTRLTMEKMMKALSFAEREKLCEEQFDMAGPFWHLFTDGRGMTDIFISDDEFDLGMVLLAVTVCRAKGVRMVTFELMNNHMHTILCGAEEDCLMLFEDFKSKLKRVIKGTGRPIDWNMFQGKMVKIGDIKQLRTEIAYVHRNAFVAQPQYTPYNYPWGGGWCFFNETLKYLDTVGMDKMSYDKKRSLTHSRDINGLEKLRFIGDRVYIPSFCDIKFGEEMFSDARSYFSILTRRAELYGVIATRIKDSVFLTDDEMFGIAIAYVEKEFGVNKLVLLSPEQRIRTAKELHFKYNASNQQLRRLLRIEIEVLEELFPG